MCMYMYMRNKINIYIRTYIRIYIDNNKNETLYSYMSKLTRVNTLVIVNCTTFELFSLPLWQ